MTYRTNSCLTQLGAESVKLPTFIRDNHYSNLSRTPAVLTKVLVAILSHPRRIKGQ